MTQQYMTLIGTEQVQSAASQMREAASEMQRAAGNMEDVFYRQRQFFDDWLFRLEAVLAAASTPVPSGEVSGGGPYFLTAWEREDYEREKRGEKPLGPFGTGAPSP